MRYADVVTAYQAIEATASRREMRDALVKLLHEAPPELLPKLVYLTQGKLYPDFEGVEIGLAERSAIPAVAIAAGVPVETVATDLTETGDLGTTAERLLAGSAREPVLTVDEVYAGLDAIARSGGVGSAGRKVELLAGLLERSTPTEARYLLRTVTGRLRLGIGDMTIIDAMAAAWGGLVKSRPVIEHAYNISSDLGLVASRLAHGGLVAMQEIQTEPFHPVRPMLAERLGSAEA